MVAATPCNAMRYRGPETAQPATVVAFQVVLVSGGAIGQAVVVLVVRAIIFGEHHGGGDCEAGLRRGE